MKKYLLPENGRFYKANLHMHTVVSDGEMTPEEVKAAYLEKGYSIVAFTDHEGLVPHNDLTDENFLAITSYEIATNADPWVGDFAFTKTYHINLYAKDPEKNVSPVFTMTRMWPPHTADYLPDAQKKVDYRRTYSVESMNALIARANEDGFLVSYNHPVWSLQNYEDYAGLEGVWGVEWHNTGCVKAGYPDTMQPIDDLLRQNKRVFPLATDDAHNIYQCFGGWVMVKADQLAYKPVMDALENGDFYSSTGPVIEELTWEDGEVHIVCPGAARVDLITERRENGGRTAAPGETLDEATFHLKGWQKNTHEIVAPDAPPAYFYLTVTGPDGSKAVTRAYYLDEIEG